MQLDAARRREQADKLAAISALERQSAEIMRHKAAMAALQGRISLMQSQLLVGGHRVEDTPQFRQLLAAEQDRIRGQYQARLAELEAEREVMAEGHAQVCWEGERRESRQRENCLREHGPGGMTVDGPRVGGVLFWACHRSEPPAHGAGGAPQCMRHSVKPNVPARRCRPGLAPPPSPSLGHIPPAPRSSGTACCCASSETS